MICLSDNEKNLKREDYVGMKSIATVSIYPDLSTVNGSKMTSFYGALPGDIG